MTRKEIPKALDGLSALSPAEKERTGIADFCAATDGYFQALGIPLLRGRIFGERDGANSPHVAVISESLAHERWPKIRSRSGRRLSLETWMVTCGC